MKEPDESLENFLKRFTPNTPSDELMQRLGSAIESAKWDDLYHPAPEVVAPSKPKWLQARFWLMPAFGAATACVAGVWLYMAGQNSGSRFGETAAQPVTAAQNTKPEFVLSPPSAGSPGNVRATDMGLVHDENGQTYRMVRWQWNETPTAGGSAGAAKRSVLMPVKLEQP